MHFIVLALTEGEGKVLNEQPKPNSVERPKIRLNLGGFASTSTSVSSSVPPPPSALPFTGIEDHFILRLPPSLTSILNSELAENDYTCPGDLSITFVSGRTAIIRHPRFIKECYPAVLVDSPTIMETYKNSTLSISNITENHEVLDENGEDTSKNNESNTSSDICICITTLIILLYFAFLFVDVGQYYKVADLNQILMVLDLDTTEGQRTFNKIPQVLQEQLLKALLQGVDQNAATPKHPGLDDLTATWSQWPDGLTPPMKSAKERRFAKRPLHASSVGELERIEREVERLLKSDGQAIESKFTLFSPDGEILLGDADLNDEDDIDEDQNMEPGHDETQNENDEDEEDYDDESSSNSASDIEDMNDFAAEIEDNLLETITEMTTDNSVEVNTNNINASLTTSDNDPSIMMVKDLEAKLAEKLKQAESVSNPLIKARIEDVIRQMEDNLKNLREKS